ncbi:hypothetical protein MHYP_G00268250 [Metynnis hypsauchen]
MTSPAKFRKDKEIIAEYETQVKVSMAVERCRQGRAFSSTRCAAVLKRFFFPAPQKLWRATPWTPSYSIYNVFCSFLSLCF